MGATHKKFSDWLIALLAYGWFYGARATRTAGRTIAWLAGIPRRIARGLAWVKFTLFAFLLVFLHGLLHRLGLAHRPRWVNWQNGSLIATAGILFLTGFAWHKSPDFKPQEDSRALLGSFALQSDKDTAQTPAALVGWRFIETESLAQLEVWEQDQQLVISLARGDTLSGLLVESGIEPDQSEAIVEALREVYNPRKLRAGQRITLRPVAGESSSLRSLVFDPESTVRVTVRRDTEGNYIAERSEKIWSIDSHWAEGEIRSSLYLSAVDAKVPLPVLARMIHIFSFTVDFQRDIRPGDSFALFYETWTDDQGTTIGNGDLLYGELILRGKRHVVWAYNDPNEGIEYFDSQGRSSRKGLMRTPIDGARLSSSYGMRKHPILGYNKMHRGVDFAAPTGTPIYAAGSGTIEAAGRNGAYGHYIRIRHAGSYKTAYAHLSSYAAGIKRGAKVSQGQVIGFVGSTGRSTGPHLHYEIILDGKQVNPSRVDLPSGRNLRLAEMKVFDQERARTFARIQKTRGDKKITALKACEAALLRCENAPPPRLAIVAPNYDLPPTGPGGWPAVAPPIKPPQKGAVASE